MYSKTTNNTIIEIALCGKQTASEATESAMNLCTKGCFPKAWIRDKNELHLLKGGNQEAVKRELLASEICQCFDIKQVKYQGCFYNNQRVTKSKLISSESYSLVSKMTFDMYASHHNLNALEICKKLDPIAYYGMNIIDYLVGNTDRHTENWGLLINNANNQYESLYPLMDFNQSFYAYGTLEGAECQTVFPFKMTQCEAAIEAVNQIGLRQIKEVDIQLFESQKEWAEMFKSRLKLLKTYTS